ncbi:polysaccharide biosynthesis protein [Clostridium sp. YIM B02505]|uniref:Polysaccharide biosynthesis protein n=1 Tax=Clostridium yunnanense TaxID=2800325 RepID=A0ABS1EJQ0_9CLOT|nr:polysaccharide biosynthesis protein [Clostridium yunnanense]MBK1809587.1 polysaccharide biosynthesis protein [Clostridium yunnanense]
MKKQSLIKGSIILGVAGIFTRFLGIFFRWPLIMLIGDEGIGYYQMTYPLYMFYVAIAAGIPVAVSKMVSESNAVGDLDTSFQTMKESFILMIILGTGMSLFLFLGAKPIMSALRWDSKSYYSIIGVAFAPICISIMSAFRGFFQGLQNMNPSAISQIIEQIGRVVIGVGLAVILLPYGIEYSAGGAAFGAAAGGFLGGIYLIRKYFKVKKSFGVRKVKSNDKLLAKLIRIAIPISLGGAVGTIASLIDSILVPRQLLNAGFDYRQATILYAQLTGKASVIVNIPLTLSVALSTSLIPIIAENYILKNIREVASKVDSAIRMSMVIAIPCTLGLYFLAEPVMMLIFPGRYEGYQILKYLAISIPFIILAQTTTAILQSTGSYAMPVINLLIGCFIKVVLTLYLIPISWLNIYGAVAASILAYIAASMLNLIYLHLKLKVRIDYGAAVMKPLAAATIMILVVLITYINIFNRTSSNGIACLISVFLGIIIYVILIVILGVFKYDYIKSKFLKRHR